MTPLVSVVIPSFQQARFLRVAIDSVLSQAYSPLEVMVLDGGSTDGSREILESYGDRIWFRSARDGGQCQAINEGFERSRGEIVAWLNSDDFYYPGAVAHAVEVLAQNPEAALVYGEGNLADAEGNILRKSPDTVPFDLWRLANHSDYILQPTVFFRRAALTERGVLDEELNWALDWDLWLRLGKRFPFAYTDKVLAASRIYGDTKTSTGGFRRLLEIGKVLHRHGVRGLSPALIAYGIITGVRKCCPDSELLTPEVMAAELPGPFRKLGAAIIGRVEVGLRRWLQNVQGIWPDGLVGKRGKLWVPSKGEACVLEIRGRNLDIARQRIALRVGQEAVETRSLPVGDEFSLRIRVPAESIPIRAELTCERTARAEPLDPRLGPRQGGCRLEGHSVLPP